MSAPSSAVLDAFLRRMACNGFMGGGYRDVSPALIPSLIWRLNRWQPGCIDSHWREAGKFAGHLFKNSSSIGIGDVSVFDLV